MSNTTLPSSLGDLAYNYLSNYSDKVIADSIYWTAKSSFYGAISVGSYLGEKLLHLPDYILNKASEQVYGSNPAWDIYAATIEPFGPPCSQFLNSIHSIVTKKLSPNCTITPQKGTEGGIETFQACDLIGPALLLAFSTKKCTENAFKTIADLSYLVSGQRVIRNAYKLPTTQCVTNRCNFTIDKTTTTTTGKLVFDAAYHGLLSAGLFFLSDYTRQGIINTFVQAGNSESTSAAIVNALVIGCIAPPIIFKILNCISDCKKPKSDEEFELSYEYTTNP